jgi:hypothetical protein
MTLADCIKAVHDLHLDAVCYGDESSALSTWQAAFIILSSIAVIATAVFAWFQLGSLKRQVRDAKDGVLQQVEAARAGVQQQIGAARDGVHQQIDANRAIQRLSSTLQMLIEMQTNEHWVENRRTFIQLREAAEGLKKHAGGATNETLVIRKILNQYELIALGIEAGILDKAMYRNYYRSTVLKDWLACAEFVTHERVQASGGGGEKYWIYLENLANEFKKD